MIKGLVLQLDDDELDDVLDFVIVRVNDDELDENDEGTLLLMSVADADDVEHQQVLIVLFVPDVRDIKCEDDDEPDDIPVEKTDVPLTDIIEGNDEIDAVVKHIMYRDDEEVDDDT